MKKSLSPIFKIVLGFAIFTFPILFAWVTLKKGFTKAYKTVSFLWLATYVIFIAYSANSDLNNNHAPEQLKILSVSNYDFTMNEQPAVSISIGNDNDNYCSITINRSDVSTNGASFSSEQKNNKSVSVDCNWDKSHYVQSSKHPTQVMVTLSDTNTKLGAGSIEVSLKLVNAKGYGEYFELNDTAHFYNNEMFDNLYFSG
ncbi:hypothetical protein [Moritella viscosa]|uniref:Uncharacterized protein n=1 Tax=Moritella viscosa TaxID=80854 RepID=A0ABY1HB03_9GAMM|nr:hypothetical protein [Moritella viscosa]SGY88848.1 Putative uncharacterized protein [Moritella viscosa]SGY96437.1 Putative uncharacterized protein [Moritella viscosa]SHO25695.1 Putative uncharacterized protein [Moritella viscosa]